MRTNIKPYILMGGKYIKQLKDDEMINFVEFVDVIKREIEQEINRKLRYREFQKLFYLLAGILYKYKEYDARYHNYLLSYVLEN